MHTSRMFCRAAAWLYLVCLIIQVYLAGLALSGQTGFQAHAMLGVSMVLVALVVLIATFVSRADKRARWLASAITAITFFQPILIGFRTTTPSLAALHPVMALVLFGLAGQVIRDTSLSNVRGSRAD